MKAKLFTFVRGLKNGTPPRFQSYLKSLTLLLGLVVSVNMWGDSVTFTHADYSGQGTSGSGSSCTATKDGITITSSNGYKPSDDHVREYSGSTIEFSGAKITKIELTSTASGTSNNGPSKIGKNDGESGSYSYSGSVGTWTNNEGDDNVVLKCSAQFRWTQIVVTYVSAEPYTVKFYKADGSLLSEKKETSAGVGVTTPVAQSTTCIDWTFAGWTTDNITEVTSEKPAKLTEANTTFHPSENCNMYPVFTQKTSELVPLTEILDLTKLSTSPYASNDFTIKWGGSFAVGAAAGSCGFKGNSNMTITMPTDAKLTKVGIHNSNSWGSGVTVVVYTGTSTSGTNCGSMSSTSSGTDQNVSIQTAQQLAGSYYLANTKSGNAWVDKVTLSYMGYGDVYLKNPECAPTYSITPSVTGSGTIKFSTDGTNWSNSIADQEADAGVFFKLQPASGYEVDNAPTSSDVEITDFEDGTYGFTMPAAPVTVSATFSCATPTFKTNLTEETIEKVQNLEAPTLSVEKNESWATYQWQSSTNNTDWVDIVGKTNASYSPSIATIGTTYYRCLLKNGVSPCGSSAPSNVVTLVVKAPSKCEIPTFSLDADTYTGAQLVELACVTEGATIYYTTNGDTPAASSTEYTGAITVNQDMTIKAIAIKTDLDDSEVAEASYTINYTVTFNANGHGTAPSSITPVKYNTSISGSKPADPSEIGYTFGGWYKELGCANAWDWTNDKVTGNITLYAKWTEKKFNVNFYVNGVPTPKSIQEGEKVIDHAPTPDAFDQDFQTFVGWSTSAINGIAEDKPTLITDETVTGTADYYAVFTGETLSNTYNIVSSDANFETGNYVIDAYGDNGDYAMGNVLSSKKITGVDITFADDKSLIIENPAENIVWKITKNNNTVTFYNAAINKYLNIIEDGKYGQLALEDEAKTYSYATIDQGPGYSDTWIFTSIDITNQQIEGYNGNFQSYSSQADGIYLYKQDIEANGYITNKTNRVTLHYDANAGEEVIAGVPQDARINKNEAFTLPTDKLTRTGYTHLGWSESKTATEPQTTITPTEDVTVYAVWEVKTTTITLSQAEATTKGTEQVIATWGQPMPTTDVTMPQREHYQFAGYKLSNTLYYNADGTSAKNWDKEDATATLIAQWIINKNKVIFTNVLDGGTIKVNNQTSTIDAVDYNSTVTITVTPSAHYTLTALTWNGNDILSTPSFTMPDEDVTIAATFTEDTKRTISWSVGGQIASTTADVYDGTAFSALNPPMVGDNAAGSCADKFMGWATEAIDGSEGIDEGNVKWATNATTSETQTTFYAVFAKSAISPSLDYVEGSWTFTNSKPSEWTSSSCSTYFGLWSGMQTANALMKTYSVSDFDSYAADANEITIGVTSLRNGSSNSILTICLVDKDGNTIGPGKTITPINTDNSSKATRQEVSFEGTAEAMGYQIKLTTYGAKVAIFGTDYKLDYHPITYINYITQCCTPYSITLENEGIATGGTFSTTPSQACEGAEVTISNTPETGYSFVKYTFTKTDGGEEIDPDDLTFIGEEFLMPNYGITIAATFTHQYTITFDNQEATTPGIESTTATYGQAMPSIVGNLPEKTNNNFGGYFDETSGNGIQYYNADGTSAKNWNKACATTLYAYWLPKTSRTISYLGDEHLAYTEKPISVDGATQEDLTIEYTVNSGYEIKSVTVKVGETTLANSEIDYDETMLYIRPTAGFTADVTITFNIDLIHATEITLSETSAEIMQGKSLQLTATVQPEVVLNKDVTWTSSDASGKISVNADGLVSVARDAEIDATATITATSVDNDQVFASCTITVLENANWYGLYDKTGAEMEDGEYIIYYDGNVLKNALSDSRIANTSGITPVEHIISIDDDALVASIVWEIKRSGDHWTIYNASVEKYAAGTGTKSEATLLDAADSEGKVLWTITKTDDAKNETYDIKNKKNTDSDVNAYLRYNNSGATFWACYAYGQSGPVSLYKKGYKPKAALVSIALEGTLSKTEYIAGDKVSIAGLTVMGGYNDGTSAAVAFDDIQWSFEPETLTELTSSVSITATVGELTDTKSYDVNVSAIPQEHVYGYFNFTTSGADITDWNDNTKWSTSYTEHTISADEADVIFKEANKATTTITTMPIVKGGDIILKLKEGNKQLTSVAMATQQWSDKEQTLSIEVSRDNTNWIKLDAAGTETTGISAAINKNDIRFVKFLFSSNSNQIGIVSISFTTSDIQYDYVRTDLVVGNYGTMCVPYAVKATDRSGATFWNIETSSTPGYTNPTSVTIVEETGDLEAGKPYIFYAEGTTMSLFFSGDKYTGTTSVPANGLYGNLTDETIIINQTEYVPGYFFVLQQKLYECGVNCTVRPNRGWIQADQIGVVSAPLTAPRRVIGNPNVAPTRIDNLSDEGWVEMTGAHKYFRNGTIIIVNEGKLYNAQGQLVK